MKLNPAQRQKVLAAIASCRLENNLSIAKISELSGVEQSQASRICMGQFSSISSNVMQICIALGFHPLPNGVILSSALASGLAALWDGSKEDEERLLALLRAISLIKPSVRL